MKNFKTPLKAIMTVSPVCVSKNDDLLILKHIYERKTFHHHILVTEENKVVGIVSLIDFMHAIGNAGFNDDHPIYKKKVNEIMSPHVVMLEGDTSIEDALHIFLKNEIHAIPVLKNGILSGIVTSTDLLRYLSDKNKMAHKIE